MDINNIKTIHQFLNKPVTGFQRLYHEKKLTLPLIFATVIVGAISGVTFSSPFLFGLAAAICVDLSLKGIDKFIVPIKYMNYDMTTQHFQNAKIKKISKLIDSNNKNFIPTLDNKAGMLVNYHMLNVLMHDYKQGGFISSKKTYQSLNDLQKKLISNVDTLLSSVSPMEEKQLQEIIVKKIKEVNQSRASLNLDKADENVKSSLLFLNKYKGFIDQKEQQEVEKFLKNNNVSPEKKEIKIIKVIKDLVTDKMDNQLKSQLEQIIDKFNYITENKQYAQNYEVLFIQVNEIKERLELLTEKILKMRTETKKQAVELFNDNLQQLSNLIDKEIEHIEAQINKDLQIVSQQQKKFFSMRA